MAVHAANFMASRVGCQVLNAGVGPERCKPVTPAKSGKHIYLPVDQQICMVNNST